MKRKSVKAAAVLMTCVMCLGNVMQAGATDAAIDNAKKEEQQLKDQKAAAQAQQQQLAAQLDGIVTRMQETNAQIDQKAAEIEQAEEDLVNAKVDEDRQYQNMKKRIRFMYENGDSEMIEILLTSKSISDMLNKAEYITKISEYDRKMLNEFKAVVEDVQNREAMLREDYAKLGALQEELGRQEKEVQTLLDSKGVEISNLESAIGSKAAEIQRLVAKAKAEEEARRQAELAAQQQQQQQQKPQKPSGGNGSGNTGNTGNTGGTGSSGGSSEPSGGGGNPSGIRFTHPCPSGHLTSGFGYRDFDNSFHKGVDFGTSGAAVPTYAAAAGRVLIAGWSNSAGNWVVISHGNGLVTKYMHHSSLSVSAGQTVSRGQQLGLTGNTGNSAGVHLHFQVEVNGQAVNPFNYL